MEGNIRFHLGSGKVFMSSRDEKGKPRRCENSFYSLREKAPGAAACVL